MTRIQGDTLYWQRPDQWSGLRPRADPGALSRIEGPERINACGPCGGRFSLWRGVGQGILSSVQTARGDPELISLGLVVRATPDTSDRQRTNCRWPASWSQTAEFTGDHHGMSLTVQVKPAVDLGIRRDPRIAGRGHDPDTEIS